MSKWKCGICNSEFDNFQAQGFGGTIYCPLCYFKELYRKNKLEIDRLNNIIKIMENYLELIYDLGYDHDGLETTGDLMNLMDELVRYATLGRTYNITEPIYENSGKKYNILHEELKENK